MYICMYVYYLYINDVECRFSSGIFMTRMLSIMWWCFIVSVGIRFCHFWSFIFQLYYEMLKDLSKLSWVSVIIALQPPTSCTVRLCAGVGVLTDRKGSQTDLNSKPSVKVNLGFLTADFQQALLIRVLTILGGL